MKVNPSPLRRALYMIALVIAGEAVFALPFHVARFFRPTVLEVFQLSATELGAAQGVYGIFALLAYFPGGPLADCFPARELLGQPAVDASQCVPFRARHRVVCGSWRPPVR